jgi:UDP-2,3-diacylglucosamine hydrolase
VAPVTTPATTLFISDLHLDRERPDITAQFLDFLGREASQSQALYILGDLFEAWIGDDDPDPDKRRVVAALRALTDRGVPCYLIHGNRDFLIGQRFCDDTGVQLLTDGTVVNLYGRRVLLLHGDTLCTDDHAYQRLRRIVRNPLVQFVLRRLSLRQRQKLAERMRAGSKAHIAAMDHAAPQIMDVNAAEVVRTFQRYGVDCMVHGHTHRPAIHEVPVDGRTAVRIVLGDWYEQGSALRWTARGYDLATLSPAAPSGT